MSIDKMEMSNWSHIPDSHAEIDVAKSKGRAVSKTYTSTGCSVTLLQGLECLKC